MKNGILYAFFNFSIEKLKKLTLVEWFKSFGIYFGSRLYPRRTDKESIILYSRVSVDIFIVLKWFVVIFIFVNSYSSNFLTVFVWYLIATNLYSYFYYHVWSNTPTISIQDEVDRARRRFMNLILAIAFSNISFAYLYSVPYVSDFKWSDELPTKIKAIWFSISNSLAANYDSVKPTTGFSDSVSMIQLIITFIFIAIILGNSIPQTSSEK